MIGLLVTLALHAGPSSDCGFNDSRLCNPSKVYYCPDTGQMVPWLAPCPALVVGPRMPGTGQ